MQYGRDGMTLIEKQVKNSKTGKTFTRSYWVRPEAVKMDKVQPPKVEKGTTSGGNLKSVKDRFDELAKTDKNKALDMLRESGITWEENKHPAINLMRAKMAMNKAITGSDTPKPIKKDKPVSVSKLEEKFNAIASEDKGEALQFLRESGVAWSESSHPAINLMRAKMAMKSFTGVTVIPAQELSQDKPTLQSTRAWESLQKDWKELKDLGDMPARIPKVINFEINLKEKELDSLGYQTPERAEMMKYIDGLYGEKEKSEEFWKSHRQLRRNIMADSAEAGEQLTKAILERNGIENLDQMRAYCKANKVPVVLSMSEYVQAIHEWVVANVPEDKDITLEEMKTRLSNSQNIEKSYWEKDNFDAVGRLQEILVNVYSDPELGKVLRKLPDATVIVAPSSKGMSAPRADFNRFTNVLNVNLEELESVEPYGTCLTKSLYGYDGEPPYLVSENMKGAILHELGHNVDYVLGGGSAISMPFLSGANAKRVGIKNLKEVKDTVSKYGGTSMQEAFSEMFALAFDNTVPQEELPDSVKKFKRLVIESSELL